MYIGDGAKLVRDAFDLAKEKILKEGRKVPLCFYCPVMLEIMTMLYSQCYIESHCRGRREGSNREGREGGRRKGLLSASQLSPTT